MSKFLQVVILEVFLLTFCYNLYCQTPSIEWKRLIGGSNTEQIKKIELIPAKGYIVLGSTNSCDGIVQNFHGQEDVFVMLIDFSGNIKWIKTFGGVSSEKPIDLIFHPYEEKIGILMSSSSKDGDFSFKKDDMHGSFFTYLNMEGETLNSLGSTFLCNKDIQPTVGKKLALSGKSSYLLRTDSYFGIRRDEFRTILSLIFSRRYDEFQNNQNISSTREEFSCHPASKSDGDIFSIVDLVDSKTGFITTGNTNTAKIVTMEYNDITKGKKNISLKNFHSDEQKKPDAFIFNLNRKGDYIKLKAGLGMCIGGKGTEIAHQIFNTGVETYRCLITSDSYDGDFKSNKGKGDVWAVDFNKSLKVNRFLNLGTQHDDKFVAAINSEESTAVLLYSGNINASATMQNSDLPLVNSGNNTNGLRLILFNDKELFSEVNFNLHDLNARVFRTIEQKLIVTSLIPKGKTNALGVICIEPLSGKVIWQKVITDYDFVSADYACERVENNFYILGTAKDIKKQDSQPDIFFMNLNSLNLDKGKPVLFNDNINSITQSDTSIINYILQSRINVDSTGENYRAEVFSIYQKDNTNTKALLAFALLSEYFGDYELAAKSYGILIGKADKVKDKANLSKWRAHQITCNFLTKSKVIAKNDTTKTNSQSTTGFYGIGIAFKISDGHILVSKVFQNYPAEISGLKPFDEITYINNVAVSNNCLTDNSVKEMLKDNKPSVLALTIKRLGENKSLNINITRGFIVSTSNNQKPSPNARNTQSNIAKPVLNTNQKEKQSFLKKMITTIQEDTLIMKNIAAAQKINYALAVLNKWSNEPVNKNFLLQIDEQLGMISSLVSVIKASNPNLSFDNGGKVSFSTPELKELGTMDYAKQEQTKFNASAKTNETKIDDNISFVKKNNFDSYSGYYECEDFSNNQMDAYSEHSKNDLLCPKAEIWRTAIDNDGVKTERKDSYLRIIINGSSIRTHFLNEMKVSSPYGWTNHSTDVSSNGQIDFATNTLSGNSISKTDVESSQPESNYHGTQNNNWGEAATIEFLPDNKIKFTSKHGWSIRKKVKDL